MCTCTSYSNTQVCCKMYKQPPVLYYYSHVLSASYNVHRYNIIIIMYAFVRYFMYAPFRTILGISMFLYICCIHCCKLTLFDKINIFSTLQKMCSRCKVNYCLKQSTKVLLCRMCCSRREVRETDAYNFINIKYSQTLLTQNTIWITSRFHLNSTCNGCVL